jgi:hypothetical protein
MNVGQLIEQLKNYPQDLRVVVNGYEGGYNDVDIFENLKIVLNYHEEWYYGKHEDAESLYGNNAEQLKTTAVDALRIG